MNNNEDHGEESRKSSQYEVNRPDNRNNPVTDHHIYSHTQEGAGTGGGGGGAGGNNDVGSGGNFPGNSNFDQVSPNFIDSQWANSILMDAGTSDYLYHIDLAAAATAAAASTTTTSTLNMPPNPSSIMQSIQYQHNIQGPPLANDFEVSGGIPERKITGTNESDKQIQRRPCDQCRRRKTKCVIIPNTNNCVQCESKQLSCTYNESKRKPMDEINELKRPRSADVNPNLAILQGNEGGSARKKISLQFPRSSFYVGPTSYLYDVNLLNLIMDSQSTKIEQVNLNNSISLRKVSDKVQFVLKDDQTPQSYQQMSNDVDTIEKLISPHGQVLIDLYFRIIHPSYPIIHKKVFLEKYSRTHREFNAPLLAAIYVLAIQWWDYDPQLNRFPKPNVEIILKIGLNNYLSEILKRPKLSAVQAGLLLLQCKHLISDKSTKETTAQTLGSSNNAADYSQWVLCCQVVSLAEELGLGLNCHDWKLPKWERGLRKRLAWAVYMEDKWLSLRCSRPSHIHFNNWMVDDLQDEDFPEIEESNDGKKIFINLIELSKILSDMLDQLYSIRAMNDVVDINQVLVIAKPLQLRLRNWYHSLPLELQMSSVQPRKLCSNGYLQLAYFSTELTLHRKIITIIYQQTKSGVTPPPVELINVCRGAAKTRILASIEFVRDLKPEHIHSFWHSFSSANFTFIGIFIMILYISAPTREEGQFYHDQILNYRYILKMSSKVFEQASEALIELDLILTHHFPGFTEMYHDDPTPQIYSQPTYNGSKNTPRVRDSPYQQAGSPQVKQQSFTNSPLTNPIVSPKEVKQRQHQVNSRTSSIAEHVSTRGNTPSNN
ncbi:Transcriptional activator protein DAL81 [Spathaspora sp. JA1]|nr:Transcriptional activator protein DAL81 [Spathaspora sp. JA1]